MQNFKRASSFTRQTNGIFAFQKHLESMHWMMWTRWIEQKKDGHEIEK